MNEMNIHSTAPKPNTSRPGKQHKIYPYLLKNQKIDRANQGMCNGYHVYPNGQRISLFGGHYGLV